MAKAQAEFTTGVMKNETVRQAAGMNFLGPQGLLGGL